MKCSSFGRAVLALTSAVSLSLGLTACARGTIAYLWAVGTTKTGASQIVGYKVDNTTGNLTGVPGQPFNAYGVNPVQIVLRPGGRFVYVINQGTVASGSSTLTNTGIDEFAVGGEGTLTFEQHYDTAGFYHTWATFDTSGNFLYVLDRYNPGYQPDPTKANYDVNGSITTFSSNATDGRLQLVTQANSTQPNQLAPSYLEVGQSPRRMAATGGCLFTLNDVGQNVTSYSISTSNGQLGTVTTGVYTVGSRAATSISTGGSGQYIFITDNDTDGTGRIFSYTVGTGCALTPFTASPITRESAGTTNPTNVFLSTPSNRLYVLNSNNTSTATNSSGSTISAYNINSGQLQELSGSPYPAGPGPQCMVEDPTSKFLYTANANDGTIRGYIYSDPTGQIADLTRGSSFQTANQALTCLTLSGSV